MAAYEVERIGLLDILLCTAISAKDLCLENF